MKSRTCKSCEAPITKYAKTGRCVSCAKAARRADEAPRKQHDSLTVSGNTGELTTFVHERVRTLEDLIRVCEIDTTTWTVERFVCNKWDNAALNKVTNKMIVTELYQVKVWLVRKVAVLNAKAELAALLTDAKTAAVPRPFVSRGKSGPHLLEIQIPDLHIGKQAWSPETGHASYDSKIALKVFTDALDALVARTASFTFERVLFVVGNDLLHSDTKQGTTNSGTQLDNDSRFQKSFGKARQMVTGAIDRLRQIAPLDVVMVPGNHDTLSVWHLGDSLECFYHGTKDVAVHNSPNPRKYYEYHQNMLLLTHGDKGKKADYPLVMATEQREMFGRTTFHEVHCGHIHKIDVQEHHGVRVRVTPALCPPDAWHAENFFVGNKRGAEAYVWHRTEGIVSIANYTVPEVK